MRLWFFADCSLGLLGRPVPSHTYNACTYVWVVTSHWHRHCLPASAPPLLSLVTYLTYSQLRLAENVSTTLYLPRAKGAVLCHRALSRRTHLSASTQSCVSETAR